MRKKYTFAFVAILCLVLVSLVGIFQFQSVTNLSQLQVKDENIIAEKSEIKVYNKTSVIEVINSKINDSQFEIAIKNNATKPINSIFLTDNEEHTYYMEMVYADIQNKIESQETFILKLPTKKDILINSITIQAVLFENGNGDGTASYITEMKDTRKGEKIQFSKCLELLKDLSLLNDDDLDKYLEEFDSKLQALPDKSDENYKNFSAEAKSGIHFGKQKVANIFKELLAESNSISTIEKKKRLLTLKSKLENIVVKL
jgi:hypothetical protein